MSKLKVAVVGGGVAGLSTAWRLSERGHAVTIFEQFPLGHDRGSSHGASRIVRKAYPDPFYTEHMLKGYPMWAELDQKVGGGILHEVGLLYFGHGDAPDVVSLVDGLASLGVRYEVLDTVGARKHMPNLKLQPEEVAVFTPEAGWVAADRALAGLWRLAQANGAQLREQRIRNAESLEKGFDRVVLCPGAWLTEFVPDAPVRVTLQTFAYVEYRQAGPVWIEDGADHLYGFPSEPGGEGVKVGVHSLGLDTDPDDPDRTPDPDALDKIRALAARRFGVHAARLSGAKGCLYTSTPTEDFVLGRMSDKTLFASACSGHGFKFGPWLGTVLADICEERPIPGGISARLIVS